MRSFQHYHSHGGRHSAPRERHGIGGGGHAGRGGREGGGWGGRGGGRRRLFDSGELRLVLLALIAEQPRHGYDLIRAIEERTGGGYAPSPGVIYPTITLLQDMALIEERKGEGARRLFAVTEAGSSHVEERSAEILGLFARLDALAVAREKTDGGPVRRAMFNLRAVLQQRLAGEDVDRDVLHEAAALIDEAAQKIERL